MKTLKILGIAAALVLLSGAVAFAADELIDPTPADDVTADDGRVCTETCTRTNVGDGEQVRTHTRTRLAWDESATACDGEQPKVRTQDRISWPEVPTEDDPSRTLTQTRSADEVEDPAAPAVSASGPGDGTCD